MFLLCKDYFSYCSIARFFGKPDAVKGEIEVTCKPKHPIFLSLKEKMFRQILICLLVITGCNDLRKPGLSKLEKMSAPGEWLILQRNYPDFTGKEEAFKAALAQTLAFRSSSTNNWNYFWTLEGPTNIGGRFNCITLHPTNNSIMYAGSASGGIFKTTDNGVNWNPVFDDQPWLSISCITLQPGNPDVIYAGTGDKNISGIPFVGDGIYKSTDGGVTWNHSGLTSSRIISEVVVDPTNTNIVYAAAMGTPFIKDNNRGVYKSVDGGATWTQSLFVNDSTGAIDIIINPQNPQILYAATWNRIRNNQRSLVYGPDAGIYKSIDGGATWQLLGGGLPTGDISRIGITMSGTNPNKLWAVYVDNTLDIQGIYTTSDGGLNWTPVNNPGFGIMGGFGWYFGRIEVNPVNDNELWLCAVDIYKSTDGGNTWNSSGGFGSPHADKHDIIYKGNNNWLLATDGGLYETNDGGSSWSDIDLIANNQFYRITYNPHQSGLYAGGVQDNGSNVGNASSIDNWQRIFGADGFQMRYDPSDPDIVYAEYQNGGIVASTDGGFSFMDITQTIDPNDRRSWDMPYILNPANPQEMYTGTYRVYKNSGAPADTWIDISPDLTDGVIFGDRFHTITAIDQSALNNNHISAGTSDGNFWISTDDGANWNNVTTGLPDRYVTSVHFSPNNQNTIYVTHSGYKDNDFIPHVHRSANNGTTWTDISSNLPQLAVNDIYIYPGNDSILFVATDAGVFGSTDAGVSWNNVGNNLPPVAVYDIDYDPVNHKLLAGTFARSMWSFPVDSILTGMKEEGNSFQLSIYPNPSSEFIYISGMQLHDNDQIELYAADGKRIQIVPITDNSNIKISLKNIPAGNYFIAIKKNGEYSVKKFVKY